jgi:hypothetical protein
MAEKSKTDRAASDETPGPAAQRPAAKPREMAGSAYDSFWHCLSGRRPAERWGRDSDVTPLRSLRAAFGLAEEAQPIDYGPKGAPGRTSAAAKPPAAPDAGTQPTGTGRTGGARRHQ